MCYKSPKSGKKQNTWENVGKLTNIVTVYCLYLDLKLTEMCCTESKITHDQDESRGSRPKAQVCADRLSTLTGECRGTRPHNQKGFSSGVNLCCQHVK